jgi:hypothetical protein
VVHLGLLLYFIYDDSPEQARTHKLVDGAFNLITSLLALVRTPIFKPFRGRLVSLLTDAGLAPLAGTALWDEELS